MAQGSGLQLRLKAQGSESTLPGIRAGLLLEMLPRVLPGMVGPVCGMGAYGMTFGVPRYPRREASALSVERRA